MSLLWSFLIGAYEYAIDVALLWSGIAVMGNVR